MKVRVLPLAVALAAGATALVAPAEATTQASFTGTCDLRGRVTFAPALTAAPQQGRGRARAEGTCTGTLTDARGDAHAVAALGSRYRAHDASDTMGCAGGPASGAGVLVIGHTTLRFRLDEVRAIAASSLRLAGEQWSADGVAEIDPKTDPVAAAQRCGGEGIRSVPIGISLRARAS